eukprot:scaffold118644_cov71-Phaeocystis_antarctica.AAC.4
MAIAAPLRAGGPPPDQEVLALVGPRGLEFELGGMTFKVPPELTANSPPEKGSWRRSGAAPATTRAPYKHRAAKHEAAVARPSLPLATPHPSDCQPTIPSSTKEKPAKRSRSRVERLKNDQPCSAAFALFNALRHRGMQQGQEIGH